MNLSATITERDKKLLLFVGIVGFLVLFITFMLMPGLSAMNEAKADLADAEALRSDMEYNIALATAADQNATTAKNDLNAVAARFYPMMENEDLDSLITGLELSHSLNPLTLNITSAQPQTLTGYIASARAGESAAAAAAAGADSAAADATATDTTTDATADAATDTATTDAAVAAQSTINANTDFIYSASIACTASGTRESFVAMLDDLAANYPSIQVTDFSITDSSYLTEDEGVQTSSQFSFTLLVYMCDKEALN